MTTKGNGMVSTGAPPSAQAKARSAEPGRDRRGFALMLVVFLLFAIGVLGATGYQVVSTEAAMALTEEQGSQAFTAAHAGLQRFMSEYTDTVPWNPPEVTYTIPMDPNQDVRAVVVPTLVWNGPLPNRTYRLTSVGTFVDPRFSGSAAERTVSVLAEHRLTAVRLHGALVSPSTDITIDDLDSYAIDGRDVATSTADCPYGGTVDLRGVIGAASISISPGNSVAGSPGTGGPPRAVSYGSPAAVLDSLDIDWEAVTSPSFPVEHDGVWPSFGSIPADSFPVIRWNGDFQADASRDGRGLLIVTGQLDLDDGFDWDGLILASRLSSTIDESFTIRGLLVVGLDGSGDPINIEDDGTIHFHSCNVARAGAGLGHLVPLPGTWWEQF